MRGWRAAFFPLFLFLMMREAETAPSQYPLTISNCGAEILIPRKPHCAIFHDVNIAEMGFALHLQNEMCGVTGISGWNKETPSFRKLRGNVPERAPRYPSLETLIASHADLFVAGWNYGMNPGGDVTPERLARYHVPAIILSESCLRQWHHPHFPVTLDALLYNDLLRLGRIFDRQDVAQSLVASMKARVAAVRARIAGQRAVPVFLYDSGTDAPLTAGRYALASRIITLAGGRNIADDLPTNWGRTSWERVAMRQPEALIFVDYGQGVSQKAHWVRHQRLLQQSPAVRHHHYIALPYDALTPGPANIDAIEALARFLHPDQKM
ncbi:ABC transporter substrate-binding protein [Candidatus Kirkpatrickella diaphorinae]|uniref:ABC transporter substrate-binding protein n=1 Tax=Candidatus Kirkpatrickella diaphorinae TaxID=2984322 RepID=A0ABY6GIW0_9PROT|nr:ABC transporter substrate-binding protein [Candidatus Kirkpatrickella diaphorinae]UYH51194.1 ABC transporter substrate-binding protein [Candidatus Kirkpatrickella diaphorinae]